MGLATAPGYPAAGRRCLKRSAASPGFVFTTSSIIRAQVYSCCHTRICPDQAICLTVSGYMGRMFAQNYPLSVSISITFEQSYNGIGGDSASSTYLYAVLSSLSGIPIQQGVAVTGSVNQKGEIQAVETGDFHIYAVASIEQGIAVLTGLSAGKVDSEFNYPENTVSGPESFWFLRVGVNEF